MLHLDINAGAVELNFDIFVALDRNCLRSQSCGRKEALNCVQVLEKVATMHGFDSNQLCGVQNADA
ncbi:hypothetical protein MES4922_550038 [Mesorhizobium ventifaucium]|uniref:Uncharacterized protein n=1 Tax=Mesorhizobium ventifaucium TaxID=666020 RepID=A0ABN8K944_9HYPH|nr:hypothetical protein MES4922_550038 [Mesorhizobium ventifaucium]